MSCNSASLGPRRRNSEDKLYQACLNACIVGIENIPVDKRRPGGGKCKISHLLSRFPITDTDTISLSHDYT